eukprot:TRINITY_DN95057_c0_g1_i1.p1 TRINITY_DN95057_c0_g1~~TRINITY_DN95057_c0_g1_i1.p1  ORF type:complete len:127 (+),score=10.19 TRINITY_DN95057_c0_g1_i1:134-514(+)
MPFVAKHRKRTAAGRRAQQKRSYARVASKLICGFREVAAHRGNHVSKPASIFAAAIAAALAKSEGCVSAMDEPVQDIQDIPVAPLSCADELTHPEHRLPVFDGPDGYIHESFSAPDQWMACFRERA